MATREDILEIEQQIATLTAKLAKLRGESTEAADVSNYPFKTLDGDTDLVSLFGAGRSSLPSTTWVKHAATARSGRMV